MSLSNKEVTEELTRYNYKAGQKFTHKAKKMVIVIDWFQFSITSPLLVNEVDPKEIINFGDDVLLVKEKGSKANGVKDFKHCYQCLLNDEPFLLINTCPRASIIDANLSTIKVENHWLYRRGFVSCIQYVLEKLNATVRNVSRLDIAVDGGKFIKDFGSLLSGKYLKLGKATVSAQYDSKCKLTGGYVGSRSSDRFCRIYDKSLCMSREDANKPYIREYWKKNNISEPPNVERLELTLKRKAIRTIKDFDWSRVEEGKYLAGIMQSQLQKFYTLIPSTGSPNLSRRQKYQVCYWPYFDAVEVERLPKTNKPNIIWRVKNWVTHEMQRAFSGLDPVGKDLWDNAFNRCYKECRDYGILDWFEDRLTKWEEDKKIQAIMRKKIYDVRKQKFRSKSFTVQHPI